jgi:hypothetical protein
MAAKDSLSGEMRYPVPPVAVLMKLRICQDFKPFWDMQKRDKMPILFKDALRLGLDMTLSEAMHQSRLGRENPF